MRVALAAALLLAATPVAADPVLGLEPTSVRVVEVERNGAWVRWGTAERSRRMAMMRKGTRVAVRGLARSEQSRACRSGEWFAIEPRGFVCAADAAASQLPPGGPEVLEVSAGRVLPHRYGVVRADATPVYEDAESVRLGAPLASVERGTKIVLRGRIAVDGVDYVRNRRGHLLPRESVGYMGQGSQWAGVPVDTAARLPFGWITARSARVHDAPDGRRVDLLAFRTRVEALEERDGWVRVGEGRWVRGRDLGLVRRIARPDGTGPGPRWIDVDQGEQTLVLYENDRPVFATLVSAGRGHKTPRGNYPIWAKIAEITMDNQPYEDRAYTVEGVPWVLFFQEHNAIHGTYWHDSFGRAASHGCVNLSPLDARWLFDWTEKGTPVWVYDSSGQKSADTVAVGP